VSDDVRSLETRITGIERQLAAIAKEHDTVRRLLEIPGVGLLTATALVGSVGRISAFRRARQFASWLGLLARTIWAVWARDIPYTTTPMAA